MKNGNFNEAICEYKNKLAYIGKVREYIELAENADLSGYDVIDLLKMFLDSDERVYKSVLEAISK